MRCRDAHSEIVRRPLRVGATLEFGSNVNEPCPACGGQEWEIARWPWVGETEPKQVYVFSAGVCCGCGHTETLGGKPLTDEGATRTRNLGLLAAARRPAAPDRTS